MWDCFPDRFTWSWAFANLFWAFAARLRRCRGAVAGGEEHLQLGVSHEGEQVFSGTLVQVELGDRPRRHDGVGKSTPNRWWKIGPHPVTSSSSWDRPVLVTAQ